MKMNTCDLRKVFLIVALYVDSKTVMRKNFGRSRKKTILESGSDDGVHCVLRLRTTVSEM